jgi:hypothetical protein
VRFDEPCTGDHAGAHAAGSRPGDDGFFGLTRDGLTASNNSGMHSGCGGKYGLIAVLSPFACYQAERWRTMYLLQFVLYHFS